MKQLHFDYRMQIEYSVEVSRCSFTIKCIPKETARQKVVEKMIELEPETAYSFGVDGLQNEKIYGMNEKPHKSFVFRITGTVLTGCAEYEEVEDDRLSMIFSQPYGMNIPGEKIRQYHKTIRPEETRSLRERAQEIMHHLHRDFSYVPCTTDVNTTAEEAFVQGHGVCQDYAHIFLALLHLEKIPARYVTGLLIGEGASHAWVEILEDHKWYGLDPTNDMKVGEDHIKIGVGRDAHDCMINRGIMHGGGLHTQMIHVTVKKLENI